MVDAATANEQGPYLDNLTSGTISWLPVLCGDQSSYLDDTLQYNESTCIEHSVRLVSQIRCTGSRRAAYKQVLCLSLKAIHSPSNLLPLMMNWSQSNYAIHPSIHLYLLKNSLITHHKAIRIKLEDEFDKRLPVSVWTWTIKVWFVSYITNCSARKWWQFIPFSPCYSCRL